MSEANVINAVLAAGIGLFSVGAGVRFGWDVGAMACGSLLLLVTVWAVRVKRGR